MYKRFKKMSAKFKPYIELLEAAGDQPLSDREMEVCIDRMEAVWQMVSMERERVPKESPEFQLIAQQVQESFLDENGRFAPFDDRLIAWTIDLFVRRKLFKEEAKLEEAKERTQNHYRDGKPFSCRRWMLMELDVAKATALGQMRLLS